MAPPRHSARPGVGLGSGLLLGALVLATGTPRAEAWGFAGHRLVNRRAIETLPEPLHELFAANAAYLTEHSVDPDLWRNVRAAEAPNHFLDMDAFGAPPFPGIPHRESEHLARNGAEAAVKGRVPWRIGEGYHELVDAFRSGDLARVLEKASILGHYVADAHVPFHAALNYDGQLTGQTGVHERWESAMVERFLRQIDAAVLPAAARTIGDPVETAFEILTDSFARSVEALDSDRASAGPRDLAQTPADDRYDDGYYTRLYERESGRVQSRLARAASTLGSFWLSAWIEAGRPPLDTRFRFPYVRKDSRVVLLSLDGASATVMDDAVRRGIMPNLRRLREAGATAQVTVTLPCKTASGHASLYTGAWPDVSGITGNEAPRLAGSLLETDNGYGSTRLLAEPIWVAAARQGLFATVATATQVAPFGPYFEEKRFGGNFNRELLLMDGYRSWELADAVYHAADLAPAEGPWLGDLPAHEGPVRELRLEVAGIRIDGVLYDDPADPAHGFDTLYLTLDRDPKGGITLKPTAVGAPEASAFQALALEQGGGPVAAYFRLFALSGSGDEVVLYRSRVQRLRASSPAVEAASFGAIGGFVGNAAMGPYERGELGPTLVQGGDGTAERRYLETVALTTRQAERLTAFCLKRTPWDLAVGYLPFPDELLHLWLGYLDPDLPGHDPALARRLRPFLDDGLRLVDAFLGQVDAAAPGAILAVASDHGMIGASRVVRPNVALARAGLLGLDGSGNPDLGRTLALYSTANSGYVLLNRESRPGGAVRPEQEEDVRRRATAALAAIRDPATGKAIVTVIDPRKAPPYPGLGGPAGGDLYLALAPGYELSAAAGGDAVGPHLPAGVHLLNPERPAMRAAFTVAGPGVAAGVDLGVVPQVDIAPTLCALLGIDPPANASGKVLERALARKVHPRAAGSPAPGSGP